MAMGAETDAGDEAKPTAGGGGDTAVAGVDAENTRVGEAALILGGWLLLLLWEANEEEEEGEEEEEEADEDMFKDKFELGAAVAEAAAAACLSESDKADDDELERTSELIGLEASESSAFEGCEPEITWKYEYKDKRTKLEIQAKRKRTKQETAYSRIGRLRTDFAF
jgi:hypothetical protein